MKKYLFLPFILFSNISSSQVQHWICFSVDSIYLSCGYQFIEEINVCEDENSTILISSSITSFGAGGMFIMNKTEDCDTCFNIAEPIVTINYPGGTIVNSNISYSSSSLPHMVNCPLQEELTINIISEVSDTLEVSWTNITEEIFCTIPPQTIQRDFYGDLILNVIPMPTPALATTTPIVQPGDNISFTIDSCLSGVRAYLIEECEIFDPQNPTQTPLYCNGTNTLITNVQAPNYTTELTYQVVFERYNGCDYGFTYSNLKTISVEELPNPNACNSSEILYIESLLSDQNNQNRRDYHFYEIDNVVCNTSFNSCSVEDVWSFMKSNVIYQLPVLNDFDEQENALYWREMSDNFISPYLGIPFVNCALYEIPATFLRSLAWVFFNCDFANPNNPNPCDYFNSSVSLKDPVKIVIDESCKCITNYTLPGHILYPGKVRRCITQSNCDIVKVKTRGIGLHFLGDNAAGEWFGERNIIIGTNAFQNVDDRFILDYINQ